MKTFEPIRKIDSEKVVISMRLREDLLTIVDELARKTDISRNEFLNQCITFAIENLRIENTDKKEDVSKKN